MAETTVMVCDRCLAKDKTTEAIIRIRVKENGGPALDLDLCEPDYITFHDTYEEVASPAKRGRMATPRVAGRKSTRKRPGRKARAS